MFNHILNCFDIIFVLNKSERIELKKAKYKKQIIKFKLKK